MAFDFITRSDLFTLDIGKCTRTDYLYNYCNNCMNVCPTGALDLVRGKLKLDAQSCTNCGVCLGACPTEALSLESFDPNTFRVDESYTMDCRKNIPCLNSFDHYHFANLALMTDDTIECNISNCKTCEYNSNGKVLKSIHRSIDAANDLFQTIGVEKEIVLIEDEVSEKPLFKPLFVPNEEDIPKKGFVHRLDSRVPVKQQTFNALLKEGIEHFETTSFELRSPFISEKTIDFDACTLCNDCIEFCPTDALFSSSDKQAIFFQSSKCIGCGICDGICKTNAVGTKDHFDLVEVAFGKAQELVRYEMALCLECKCAYPYKGGEQICDRCIEHKDAMDDMMTLARDM
jgi:ferredoxin